MTYIIVSLFAFVAASLLYTLYLHCKLNEKYEWLSMRCDELSQVWEELGERCNILSNTLEDIKNRKTQKNRTMFDEPLPKPIPTHIEKHLLDK